MTAAEFAALVNGKPRGDGWYEGQCPAHADKRASLSFRDGDRGLVMKCHAGCTFEQIAAALGRPPADFFHQDRRDGRGRLGPIVKTYDYLDEGGRLLYQVTRHEPKDFRQRQPDPNRPGEWIHNIEGVQRVLYRLPGLAHQVRAFIVEGEKDADRLHQLGLTATTNVMGALKWKTAYTAQLLSAGVTELVVLPDNDDTGRAHARQVARSCLGAGITVKIVELPGLSPKGDVSDWLATGHTPADLEAIVEAAHAVTVELLDELERARPGAPGCAIDAGDLELPRVTEAAWAALLAANDPPVIFRYGLPAWIDRDDGGLPVVRHLNEHRLRHRLARVASWYVMRKSRGGGRESALPPVHVVRDMLARPNPPLPVLERVVEAPIFTIAGEIHSEPGYDPASLAFYAPSPGFSVPDVPEIPSARDVTRARALLLEELLVDFPFVSDAERAHAVALLLLPFVRDLVHGATPLHLIEKPAPGTGGSLLGEVCLYPALGRPVPSMTEARDADEWRKRLTSKLMTGPTAVSIDNLHRRLDSEALSSAISSPIWEDRVLGHSEMVRLPIRCAWVATGNNPALSAEITRRTVRIRLDARVERPWLRAGFRHPQLREWVASHRGELCWAALTLGRAWLAAGSPEGGRVLGTCEAWARVLGGILTVAQIPGFLENLEEFYDASDIEGAETRAFLGAWWEKHRDQEVTVAQLFELATAGESPLDLDAKSDRGRKIRLGLILREWRDRQYRLDENGLAVTVQQSGSFRNQALWRVARCGCGDVCGSSPPHLYTNSPVLAHGGDGKHPHRSTHPHDDEPPAWVKDGGEDPQDPHAGPVDP